MANIVDETNRELWNGIKNTPERLFRLLKAIEQMHEWYERHQRTTLKDNYEDLKKSYEEQTQKLNEAEYENKKMVEDLKKRYDENIETINELKFYSNLAESEKEDMLEDLQTNPIYAKHFTQTEQNEYFTSRDNTIRENNEKIKQLEAENEKILQTIEKYEKGELIPHKQESKLNEQIEDLNKSYEEYLLKLGEMEKVLSEKYNAIYETAIEKENYELILPETYKQIKDDVVFSGFRKMNDIVINEHLTSEQAKKQLPELYDKLANSYSFKDLSKDIGNNADFRQFIERYSEEYEDFNMDDFVYEDGSLNWNDLLKYTDISDDFFKPVFNAIVRDETELHKAAEEYLFDLEATEAELMSGNLTFDDDGLEL